MSTNVMLSFADLMKAAETQLLPQDVRAQLPPLYAMEHEKDPLVRVKLFAVFSRWTWYLYEGSPVDEDGIMIEPDAPAERQAEAVDFLFYGLVDGEEAELGYVSLREIMSVTGPLGLKIERDQFWKPKPLSEIRASL